MAKRLLMLFVVHLAVSLADADAPDEAYPTCSGPECRTESDDEHSLLQMDRQPDPLARRPKSPPNMTDVKSLQDCMSRVTDLRDMDVYCDPAAWMAKSISARTGVHDMFKRLPGNSQECKTYCSEIQCLLAAHRAGLWLGNKAQGEKFSDAHRSVKGCYAYRASHSTWGNDAFFGNDGEPEQMATELDAPRYRPSKCAPSSYSCAKYGLFVPSPSNDYRSEDCKPCSEEQCLVAAHKAGLWLGDKAQGAKFAGADYRVKGCYAYRPFNSKWGGAAFFGNGGSPEEQQAELDEDRYRVPGCDYRCSNSRRRR